MPVQIETHCVLNAEVLSFILYPPYGPSSLQIYFQVRYTWKKSSLPMSVCIKVLLIIV